MNAAIRAVVKASLGVHGNEVFGIRQSYQGLLAEGGVFPLTYEAISGILPRGGTILGTANRGNPFAVQSQVDLNDMGVQTARDLGTCLGDRFVAQRELEE